MLISQHIARPEFVGSAVPGPELLDYWLSSQSGLTVLLDTPDLIMVMGFYPEGDPFIEVLRKEN